MSNKFNLSGYKTTEERINMAMDEDCPIDILNVFINEDTEDSVVESVIFNKKTTPMMLEKISIRIKQPVEVLLNKRNEYLNRDERTLELVSHLKKTFCTVPWTHAATYSDGKIRVCCQMIYDDETMPYGTLLKKDNKTLAAEDGLINYRNIDGYKKIRKEFLEGGKPSVCKLCWDEERIDRSSQRISELSKFGHKIYDIIEKTEDDGSIKNEDFPIQSWDLRFGNKCNLKCRTCGPVDSSKWFEDWIKVSNTNSLPHREKLKLVKDSKGNIQLNIPDYFEWYNNSILWDEIVNNIDNIKYYYFTGGEPTINDKHKELLQIIIDKDLAHNVNIRYNTNFAAVPNKIFDYWSKFKTVQLGMSIDGIYNHFNYIRHPRILENDRKTFKKNRYR